MRALLPLLSLLAFGVGGGITVQAAINARLGDRVGHALTASIASFFVGLAGLLVAALAVRAPVLPRAPGAPWWLWTGGLFGATYIAAAVTLAPRLGPGLFFALLVAGQLTAALLIEQFGLLGFAPQPVTAARMLGVACLLAGVLLIRRG